MIIENIHAIPEPPVSESSSVYRVLTSFNRSRAISLFTRLKSRHGNGPLFKWIPRRATEYFRLVFQAWQSCSRHPGFKTDIYLTEAAWSSFRQPFVFLCQDISSRGETFTGRLPAHVARHLPSEMERTTPRCIPDHILCRIPV